MCWRIDPNKLGWFQLLDDNEVVVYSDSVKIGKTLRSFWHGNLRLTAHIGWEKKHYHFQRHPGDSADLEANGFKSGKTAERYNKKTAIKKAAIEKAAREKAAREKAASERRSLEVNCSPIGQPQQPAPHNIRYNQPPYQPQQPAPHNVRYNQPPYQPQQPAPLFGDSQPQQFVQQRRESNDFYSFEKAAALKKAAREKIDAFDMAVCWRIDPGKLGWFQLLDDNETVVHSGSVKIGTRLRSLWLGKLRLTVAIEGGKNHYYFARHPGDSADLEANGFKSGKTAEKYNEKAAIEKKEAAARAKAAAREKAAIFKSVVCWRIYPNKPGWFQLLDKDGTAVYSYSVEMGKSLRSLWSGKLRLSAKIKGEQNYYYFKRHPGDSADLEANGFKPGQTAKYLKDEDIPSVDQGSSSVYDQSDVFMDIFFNQLSACSDTAGPFPGRAANEQAADGFLPEGAVFNSPFAEDATDLDNLLKGDLSGAFDDIDFDNLFEGDLFEEKSLNSGQEPSFF